MKRGTKSLLFGGHQFIIHPVFVLIAWLKLYKRFPSWRILLTIIIHDWGYWGLKKMDDEKGEQHPEWAGRKLSRLFGGRYHYLDKDGLSWTMGGLSFYHSRFIAKKNNSSVSPLCLPDKYGVALMPTWLWVLLVTLSGEGKEYLVDTKYETNNIMPTGSRQKGLWKHFKQYKNICSKWVNGKEPLCPWRG